MDVFYLLWTSLLIVNHRTIRYIVPSVFLFFLCCFSLITIFLTTIMHICSMFANSYLRIIRLIQTSRDISWLELHDTTILSTLYFRRQRSCIFFWKLWFEFVELDLYLVPIPLSFCLWPNYRAICPRWRKVALIPI